MYNQGLSQRRASAVAAELVTAGVAQKFLTAKGFGSRFPIAPNARSDGSDDPQGRARNRRVEIVVETALTPGG
jgi:outer membrane protein OmpA-like peptidoglycan-associated protein